MTFANIPDAMKQYPNWIVWKLEDGKKPYSVGGYLASTINPSTWTSFQNAVAAYERGGYSGIGFVFTNTPFIGFDADHVYDPEKRGLDRTAAEALGIAGETYIELSQSGTGFHAILKGKLPEGRRKNEPFEMYGEGSPRFFAMTGNRWSDTSEVREDQVAIDAIHSKYIQPQGEPKKPPTVQKEPPQFCGADDSILLERMGKSKQGALFSQLWEGDTTGYNSHSEADIALCNTLAFWCRKDAGQMDRLFRQSGLMREKWDRSQSGTAYGAITIQNAIDTCTEIYDPKQYKRDMAVVSFGKKTSPNPAPESYEGMQVTISIVKSALQVLGITVRYNQLLKETDVNGLPDCYSIGNAVNVLPVFLMDYLKACEAKGVTQQAIDGYLNCIADENRYNPVKEMLESCHWNGVDRLNQIYSILDVAEPKYQTYIRKWLIQCIALALNDEENPVGAEGVLVLQGAQGLAKTSFFRALVPNPRWFCEGAVIDVADKDTLLRGLGAWITELGELDSTLKREQSALKAFITQTDDRIRAPYARNATRSPRRTSFCGTVNPADYLRDETGSRRFWTVPVTHIDKKTLFSLPHDWAVQLWGQIYKMYQENSNGFRLTDAEMKQLQADNRTFSIPLPFETEIRELLDYTLPVDQWQWWRAKAIRNLLPSNADAVRVGKALKKVVEEQVANTPLTPLTPLKNPRIKDGNTEYFIPLKHFSMNTVERVG